MKSLLFIPDISGFTSFVHSTEINHSKHIIKELLELLISANDLGMELVEIEGDALFFIFKKQVPSLKELEALTTKLHREFHMYLHDFSRKRVCPCGACKSAIDLNLKFVSHISELDFIEVAGQRKPFGPDVIQVHRMLKNSVKSDEYSIISDEYLREHSTEPSYEQWKKGTDNYDFGLVKYAYKTHHKKSYNFPALKLKQVQNNQKRLVSIEHIFNANLLDLSEYILDFDKRKLWSTGIKEIKHNPKELNHIGAEHLCILEQQELLISTVAGSIENKDMLYIEETNSIPFTKNLTVSYSLKQLPNNKVNFHLEVFCTTKHIFQNIMHPVLSRNLNKGMSASMKKLNAFFPS